MQQRAASTIAHLKEVAEYTKRLGVSTKLYINPLNSLKESFYKGGILFSCLYDKKMKDVFAAGGRYDHLIKEQRPNIGGQAHERHAVGFSLAWERLARTTKGSGKAFIKKGEEDAGSLFGSKRVCSSGSSKHARLTPDPLVRCSHCEFRSHPPPIGGHRLASITLGPRHQCRACERRQVA